MQITVNNVEASRRGVDAFVRYKQLSNVMLDAKNSRSYCKSQYWHSNEGSEYDLTQLTTGVEYTNSDTVLSANDKGSQFCDRLYSSMESSFVISDSSGAAVDVQRGNGSSVASALSNNSADACRLTRVISKLA